MLLQEEKQMNNNLKITADEGYWFGLGAFETIWVYKNKAVFIDEHLDRLKNAVNFLNITQEPVLIDVMH